MRRRSFNRPKEKLRGIKRRLKALDKWADAYEGCFPLDSVNEKFWNCKVPVVDRLVNPPASNKKLQAHCATAMLRAACFIQQAKPANLPYAKVTVLLTYPDMFDSELCVFFDKAYFKRFFSRNSPDLSLTPLQGKSLLKQLNIYLPQGFKESGFHCIINDEWDGENHQTIQQWWSYQI